MGDLKVEGIVKNFGGVMALNCVSFSAHEREILAIIGPNGAGKTTLINGISGIYKPDAGRIFLGEEDITFSSPSLIARKGIARTFQNIALFRGMTVLDNLMLGRHVHMEAGVFACSAYWGSARREEIRHRRVVEDVIEFLEIEHIRKRIVGVLPLGLQKRVELGRALALHPKILLLDEPMGGMNTEEKEDMARFILDVNDEWGATILLIEHDMGVVMDISHRVVVLDLGEKIAEGTPDQVKEEPSVIKAYLGTKATAR